MGLDKAIEHGKEHRKQYRDLRFYHRNFRNHGGSYWDDNRRHKFWVKEVRSMQDLKEYFARAEEIYKDPSYESITGTVASFSNEICGDDYDV